MSNTTGSAHLNGTFTVGWSFETTSTLVVDRLGVFANNGGGLVSSHPVAIWNSQGAIVAETTVAAGDKEPLINQFRYHRLDTPVTLPAGMYTIGAFYSVENGENDDFVVSDANNFATIPQLKYGKALYTSGDSLMQPGTAGVATKAYFGPNFTVIPEPSSLTLATTAALGSMVYLWLRQHQVRRSNTAGPATP